LGRPDILGVVLNKARLGKNLAEFLPGFSANATLMVEHQGAGDGRSLVQGKDEAHRL
jgi:predicted AAA+ superfamily ATPase